MKRRIATYSAIWAICLAIFNVITFVTPNEIGGVSKFNATFWVGYIFITVAFVGQLVCSLMALKEKRARKLFYKLPMAFISYSGLIAMLVAGGIVFTIGALLYIIGKKHKYIHSIFHMFIVLGTILQFIPIIIDVM